MYEPRQAPLEDAGASHEHALRRAGERLRDCLTGLDVEQLVLPGASAARVLHKLADERRAQCLVVASSPQAPWGHAELGHVSQRLCTAGPRRRSSPRAGTRATPMGCAPSAWATWAHPSPTTRCRPGAALAAQAGATVRVVTVFDPTDYAHAIAAAGEDEELREPARRDLDAVVRSVGGAAATGELVDGDPAETLTRLSVDWDLLVLGSRSYGPLRAVLLGGVSGVLVHRAGCSLMVVPHVADPEHEVTLVGGLEAHGVEVER